MPIPSPVLPAEKNSSVCKSSILKSWKSASGSLSAQLLHNGRAQHFSEAPLQDMLMKHRRSSLLDGIAFTRRGSIVSFSTLADIPASPALPEQFGYMQPLRLKAVAAGREGEERVPA
ncbi:hypothetical protein SCP_0406110 [Sparassis crispa]|uniref:Uncharacterized protein n=1 Tax=Sparassis crispa TaxID=139825 RepID=A0A401GJ83_9APHY|nr:hypothetical protein SCP_0406110 [Sparassis crispa]GBE82228.1 hypothetical protein SCP_0406110 [Sparassis crispa]